MQELWRGDLDMNIDEIDYDEWIDKHLQEKTYEDYMSDTTNLVYYVRLPFFITKIVTELDKKLIKKMHLHIYAKEGTEELPYRSAMKFKFGMRIMLDLNIPTDTLIDLLSEKRNRTIDDIKENILRILDTGTIVHNVRGYCDNPECNCNSEHIYVDAGHICGTITHYVDGFCPYDFEGSQLRVKVCE